MLTEQEAFFTGCWSKDGDFDPCESAGAVVKALFWGLTLSLSIAGGALWFAYWYMTDSDTAAHLIRERAVNYFPGSSLEPGRVRVRPLLGEVVFNQLHLVQRIDGAPFEVLRIPYMNIRINTRKLAKGEVEAKEVVVSMPTLRLRRRRDGTWNLDGLLADPWPRPVDQHAADSHPESHARALCR